MTAKQPTKRATVAARKKPKLAEKKSVAKTDTGAALTAAELKRISVLDGVTSQQAKRIIAACPVVSLPEGVMLLEAGQRQNTVYMIVSGRLSVHLESAETDAIAFLDAGETVGEISVIDARPGSAYVRTAAPTRVLAIDEIAFWKLVHTSHEFAVNLLRLLSRRMRANNSAVTQATKLKDEFEHAALVDGLTSVFNRRWLEEKAPRLVARHLRSDAPLSVLMIDIDFFKKFNDNFGHASGDAVLIAVARTLGKCLRPTDLLARYGGEEFGVFLPDTSMEHACHAAERLRSHVERTIVTGPGDVQLPRVTISLGAATLAATDNVASLIARADSGLYRAKANGRNRVEPVLSL